MDLLFKRYADPFSLLDGFIQTSRFCDFIHTFGMQKAEDDRWEYWLHKVWNMSYAEYCQSLKTSQELKRMSGYDIEATVQKSMNILGNFTLEQEEGDI